MTREPRLRLRHVPSGRLLADRVREPRGMLGRGVGLMFQPSLPPGDGLWISPCSGIHMVGMRFAIDAVFLDRRGRVVRVVAALRPWRFVPFVWRAASVVELPSGTALGAGVQRGDELRFELGDGVRPGAEAPRDHG
ncbi:MAG: DUF192 domain-containing protein [Candidatus Dormiibacterota bacterium]